MGQNVIIVTGKSIGERYWSPSNVATVSWYDATDYSTITESGNVSEWRDKSGNGNNFAQLTGSKQPQYNAVDSVLGLPSISSVNNSGDQLDCINSTTVKRIYAIARYDDGITAFWQNHNCLLGNVATAGGSRLTGRSGGTDKRWDASGRFCDGGAFKNGSLVDDTENATPMPSTLWKFDSTINVTQNWRVLANGQSYSALGGAVGEIIMTDGTEDLATQQHFEGYLAWKWGIALAVGHPYEFARPVT